jgi:hypothetical protein
VYPKVKFALRVDDQLLYFSDVLPGGMLLAIKIVLFMEPPDMAEPYF